MKPKKNSKIFVQIASYRDPQLIPTIKNMLENAKNPQNITIGIARQFHPDDKFDDLSEYENEFGKWKFNGGIRGEYNLFNVQTADFSGTDVSVNRKYSS